MPSIPVLLVAGMFVSCGSNDLKSVNMVTTPADTAGETSFEVEMVYTDSGLVKARMKSPEIRRYASNETVLFSPRGINVTFYDSAMNEDAYMSAMEGKFFEKQRKVELRNDVVVTNSGGEKLNTEFLVWIQDSGFYTDKYVKITKEKVILHGYGMTADEHFTNYTILDPHGSLPVPKEASGGQDTTALDPPAQ